MHVVQSLLHEVTWQIALAAGTVLTVGFLYLRYRRRPLPGIPHNKETLHSLLGDLPAILKHVRKSGEVSSWFVEQCLKHNFPLVQIFPAVFSRTPLLMLTDHREATSIMTHRVHEFDRIDTSNSSWIRGPVDGSTITRRTDEKFRAQRKPWVGTMSPQFVRSVAVPHIVESADTLIELWTAKAKNAGGFAFEAQADLRHATLDIIWKVTFGSELGGLKSQLDKLHQLHGDDITKDESAETTKFVSGELPEIYTSITKILGTFEEIKGSMFPLLHMFYLISKPSYRRAERVQRECMQKLLNASREKFVEQQGQHREIQCSLDHLMAKEIAIHKDAGQSDEFSEQALLAEMFLFVVAGHETTSTTLGWGLKYLAAKPDVQSRLRQEIQAAAQELTRLNNRKADAVDIATSKVPYLDATVAEILRVAQTIVMTAREARVDTTVLGRPVPKGTILLLALNLPPELQEVELSVAESDRAQTSLSGRKLHSATWEKAADFQPARWLSGTGESGDALSFDPDAGPSLPFSVGPRGCFGKRLAMTELKILLVKLIGAFEFEKLPPALNEFSATEGVTRTSQQCHVRVKVLNEA